MFISGVQFNHQVCHCFVISYCLTCKSWGSLLTLYLLIQGFTLGDATGLAIKGDVDIDSVYATSLPTSHPSFSPQRVLEMSTKWKALPLPKTPVRLFVGILSATNHFAERMAVRKTWMQSPAIKSLDVVVRFFVALVRFPVLFHLKGCINFCKQNWVNTKDARGLGVLRLDWFGMKTFWKSVCTCRNADRYVTRTWVRVSGDSYEPSNSYVQWHVDMEHHLCLS